MNKVSLKGIIGPAFFKVHKHVKNNDYTHYWLKGGRGSLKSSFIGTEIPLGIMRDAQKGLMSNAVVIRRVKDTLRGGTTSRKSTSQTEISLLIQLLFT